MSESPDRIGRLHALLEAEPGDAFCLYSLGQEHARAGDLEEAIRWYDRAIAADPDMSYAYFHKARVLEEAGDDADAIATLRAGLEVARRQGDGKAVNELAGYLDQLT